MGYSNETKPNHSNFSRRYIYGFEIDYDFSELNESYVAADFYLLHGFAEAFFDHIKVKLNVKNSCLIYDQLLKIGDWVQNSLDYVRNLIVKRSWAAFESEQFTQIDQETLISLLSLDELSIDELHLFAAVRRWIDCELARQGLPVNDENRRKLFEPLKGYVLFNAFSSATYEEYVKLLAPEEALSLSLSRLLEKKHSPMVELKTSRKAGASFYNVFVSEFRYPIDDYEYSDSIFLVFRRKIAIRTIYTTYSAKLEKLTLKLLDSNGKDIRLNGLRLNGLLSDGRWCFSFETPFYVQPYAPYNLQFAGDGRMRPEDQLSKQRQLNYEGSTIFTVTSKLTCHSEDFRHCIRGLNFTLVE